MSKQNDGMGNNIKTPELYYGKRQHYEIDKDKYD
jgi:hypothetical protein